MSTKRGDVTKRRGVGQLAHPLGACCDAADGHATAQRFAHAQDVWNHVKLTERPRGAGASHSTLNFVEDEQRTKLPSPVT